MEELGPVLVCAAQEQFRALAAASADARCPRSFQSSHEVAGLEGKTPLKEDRGSFDRPGLPGEPLGLRIEHGTAQSHNFGGRRSKASENESRINFCEMGRTCCGGGGPSPSSAMRLMYSWSILCPPAEGPLPPCCCCQSPVRRALQSPVVWPIPPHVPHITLFVTLALSWHCHALWSVAPQLVHLAIPSSRRVPFNRASSLNCIFLSSLLPSGTSTPCWITSLVVLSWKQRRRIKLT